MSLLFGGERRAMDMSAWIRGDDVARGRSLAGEAVNSHSVSGLDAVAAAVGLLSDMVYQLPLQGFTDRDGVPVRMSPEASVISSPSLTVDARTWRAQLMVSWALWGNAYGLVVTRDRLEYPTTIEWLHPERVQVVEESTLDAAPVYRLDGTIIDPQRIVHRPGRYVVPASRIGIAPLERFRETFGLALAARNYGARWFGDGAHPSGALTSDQVLTPETAKTIKERFIAATRGRREPVVLGSGMSWKATQVAPNESQFAETSNASAVAIARSFGLPADMIDAYSQGSMTYANREQRALDFLTFSADPWLVRVEDLVTSLMPRTKYAKFNRAALLRTDSKTQAEVIDLKIRAGVLTAAEARRLLDMKPVPDEGELLWPPYSTAPTPSTASGAMP